MLSVVVADFKDRDLSGDRARNRSGPLLKKITRSVKGSRQALAGADTRPLANIRPPMVRFRIVTSSNTPP